MAIVVLRRARAMLRYAIVLQLTVMATPAFSAPVTQSTTDHKMSTVEAIKACRAALGKHGKYLQVRKCVMQKRMKTMDSDQGLPR